MINVYNIIKDPNPQLNVVLTIDEPNECLYDNRDPYDDHEAVLLILKKHLKMDKLASEHLVCVGMECGDVKGIFICAIGNHCSVPVYNRNLIDFLVLSGSERFIIVHNHPNGNLQASDEDKQWIPLHKQFAETIGMEFGGAYIITTEGFLNEETGNKTTKENYYALED